MHEPEVERRVDVVLSEIVPDHAETEEAIGGEQRLPFPSGNPAIGEIEPGTFVVALVARRRHQRDDLVVQDATLDGVPLDALPARCGDDENETERPEKPSPRMPARV